VVCRFVWGGSPEPQPDPQVGFNRVRGPGAVQGDRPISANLAVKRMFDPTTCCGDALRV